MKYLKILLISLFVAGLVGCTDSPKQELKPHKPVITYRQVFEKEGLLSEIVLHKSVKKTENNETIELPFFSLEENGEVNFTFISRKNEVIVYSISKPALHVILDDTKDVPTIEMHFYDESLDEVMINYDENGPISTLLGHRTPKYAFVRISKATLMREMAFAF